TELRAVRVRRRSSVLRIVLRNGTGVAAGKLEVRGRHPSDRRMSKITFRADDDLVEDLETLDASKSEAMREALRTYLARNTADTTHDTTDSLDALVAEHIEERVDERMKSAFTPSQPQDINVNIRLDGEAVEANEAREVDSNARKTPADG